MIKRGLVFILVFFLCIYTSYAVILVNSKDWKDVYSGMMYGNLVDEQPLFLTSEQHSTTVLGSVPTNEQINIFSSSRRPFVFGLDSTVKGFGYDNVKEIKFDSLSLELARLLNNITSFIIIDSAYGYNSIAVAPYAQISHSIVLFADRTNIVEIDDFLSERQPTKVLIYGHVDREVIDALRKYDPEMVNEDGDRFANNVAIVKKYIQIKPIGQVLLTNGEFIENSLLTGEYPVLFIGKNNVPDKIQQFIEDSEISAGVLVGNELVGTATIIRRQVGIATFVKFARSSRSPDGPISQVEDLDIFRVPVVELNINISNVRYNKLTHQIEITYKNGANVVSYFKGSYTLIDGDNEQSFGDTEPVFIAGNSYKTLAYDIQPPSSEDLILTAYALFGESKDSLEFILNEKLPISTVELQDDGQIDIKNLYFDKIKNRFVVIVQNTGSKQVFIQAEIVDILIQGEKQTISSPDIISIMPGQTAKVYIDATLDDEDISKNPTVRSRVYYGIRENGLIKVMESEFKLAVRTSTWVTYLPTVLLLIVGLLVILSLTKRKCANCGHKNHRLRKNCKKCGSDINSRP